MNPRRLALSALLVTTSLAIAWSAEPGNGAHLLALLGVTSGVMLLVRPRPTR